MPDNVITEIKISELPAANQANATDQLEANQSGTTRSITLSQVGALVGNNGVVNVKWYGAVGDGVANDTTAIQAALNTGHAVFLPEGRYRVTDMLSMPYGSGLFGETKHFTKIIVPTTFNLSALGVVRIAIETGANAGNEQAGTIRDIAIEFEQPDTAVRASLVQYPPAIYATSSGRFIIQDIRIVRGWKGLWMPGNSGGVMIDCFEASCFNQSIWMDDILDVPHLSRIHLYPFGLTTNQMTVFKDGNTVGMQCGRVDGLVVNDFFAIYVPKAIWVHTGPSAGGLSFGQLTDVMLDDSGMVIANGEWNVSNLYVAPGAVTARSLIVAADSLFGAAVNVTSLYQRVLGVHSSGTAETIYVGSAGGTCRLNIAGMVSGSFAHDRTHIACEQIGIHIAGIGITGGHFTRDLNLTAVNPTIHIRSNGRASLSNIVATDKGSGTGDLLKVDTDNWVFMNNVTSLGWTISLPANARLINHNVFSLVQTYTPVVTAVSGTITSYTATGRYTWTGKFLKVALDLTITTNGTASGALLVTLPTGFTSAINQMIPGREYVTGGKGVLAWLPPGSSSFTVWNYDNTYPAVSGSKLSFNGEIEIQ